MTMAPSVVYSSEPFIAQYNDWLTEADIHTILGTYVEFVPGRVRKADGSLQTHPIRQCQTHRIEYTDNPYFDALTQRVADFFGVQDLMCIEPLPMMKYEPGDYFDWHTDLTGGFTTQRTATMIMYLNDDFEGGATCFRHLNLKVQPRRGSALVYYYTPTQPLIHRGETVTAGKKFIINAFVRDGKFTQEDRKSVSY